MTSKYDLESLHGLTIDFVMRKHPMIKITGDGLIREHISEHDLKMLQSVEIPRHLPLAVEEIDGLISFMYGYKGKKILAVEAVREGLELHQYIAILMEVSSVLKRASDFMLNNEHYVLDPDWIMIGETWEDLFLLYLPLNQWPHQEGTTETVGERLKQFALALMPHVSELTGTMFQQFVAALDRNPFSLDEVIAVLQTEQPLAPSQPPQISEEISEEAFQEPTNEVDPPDWEEEVYVPESAQPFPWQAGLKGAIAAGLLIGAYLIWKPYVLSPENDMLFMNSGLTMLLLASGFAAVRWKTWTNDKKPPLEAALPEEPELESPEDGPKPTPWRSIPMPAEELSIHDSNTSSPDQTVLITQEDKTVLIQRHPDISNERSEMKPHLTLRPKGELSNDPAQTETRQIDPSPFIIGRDAKHAHWVINEAGVSRTHFEIVTEWKESRLRDLGSSNGTLLNEEQLAPYKWYDLQDQDKIQIGQMVFVYGKM